MTDDKPPSKRAPRKTAGKSGDVPAPAKTRTRKTAAEGDAAKVPVRPRARAGEVRAQAAAAPQAGVDPTTVAGTPRKRPAKAAATKASATPIAAVAAPTTASSARPRAAAAPSRGGATRSPTPTAPASASARPQAVRRASPRPLGDRALAGGGRRAGPAGLGQWLNRADPYLRLCRLDRPIGYLLLLWPTWWGLWAAAEGTPPVLPLVVFTLGVVLMRSAGCVINDYADRWLDPQVQRTRTRPLATGEVSAGPALALFLALLTAAFLLVLLTNALTIRLAFVGAVLAASYPFLKRYTHLPQIYLGVAFGWAIPMAFAAVQGEVPRLAWLLFLATVLWATAYDTLYAMVDRDDDVRAGAKSTAILFGDMDLVAVAMLHATFLLAMLFVGQQLQLGAAFLAALALAAALCGLQLWRARRRDRDGCFRAFLDNHWVGLVLFLGLAIGLAQR